MSARSGRINEHASIAITDREDCEVSFGMAGHSRPVAFWVIAVWHGQVMEIARRYVALIREAIIWSPGPQVHSQVSGVW